MDNEIKKNSKLLDLFNTYNLKKCLKKSDILCSKCKKEKMILKTTKIYAAPKILIIHLKRIGYSEKQENLIQFPINNFDFTNVVENKKNNESSLYDLFAIINHQGNLIGGHFFAYVRNFLKNKWYCMDDDFINDIDEKNLVSRSAYVLFYQRKNTKIRNDKESKNLHTNHPKFIFKK